MNIYQMFKKLSTCRELRDERSTTSKSLCYLLIGDESNAKKRCQIWIVPKKGYYKIDVYVGNDVENRDVIIDVLKGYSPSILKWMVNVQCRYTVQEKDALTLLERISKLEYNSSVEKATEKSVAAAV